MHLRVASARRNFESEARYSTAIGLCLTKSAGRVGRFIGGCRRSFAMKRLTKEYSQHPERLLDPALVSLSLLATRPDVVPEYGASVYSQ